jgi:hypothetical protein
MHLRKALFAVSAIILALLAVFLLSTRPAPVTAGAQTQTPSPSAPTLADFWEGLAEWVLEVEDVGLPIGESDTLLQSDGTFRSYLHASNTSAGVVDQCGQPVAFPGCTTLWQSDDGLNFSLTSQVCLMQCTACPCLDERDHVGLDSNGNPQAAQQYPRVVIADDGIHYMAYEWHAQTMLRTSPDGLTWSDWVRLRAPSGTWPSSFSTCSETERIGPHPNIRGEIHDCLVGAPPGLYVEGDTLYVFVAAGSAPGHIRCYFGDRHGDLSQLQICQTDPLFSGAPEYGPEDAAGAAANPYFDFRYVSSAEVIKDGDQYYLFYEGVRGPDELERGMDTQFGLGLARTTQGKIDGEWEKFEGNPLLMPVAFNWGIGHADVLRIDDTLYLYTATSETTRGRYRLEWIE